MTGSVLIFESEPDEDEWTLEAAFSGSSTSSSSSTSLGLDSTHRTGLRDEDLDREDGDGEIRTKENGI